jgi:hypothetical protein
VRKLGIPTTLDRFVQQAMMQVLQRKWDSTFSDSSYGFRPGRSAHQAVAQAQQHIAAGYGWVVDLDLEKFFDRVNHDKTDGSDCQTDTGQTAIETHPGVSERWGDGERTGEPQCGRDSTRRTSFALAQQPCARRTRPGVRAPWPSLCSIRGRLQYLCSQRTGGATADGKCCAIYHKTARTQGKR